MNWDEIVEIGKTNKVDVELLHFDIDNPRFTPDKQPDEDTDAAIIRKLTSSADLPELIQSISTSGYINIEPLIVVIRDEKLIVLEGNRRLAALKALRSSELAEQARLSVPEFSEDIRETLNNILVYRVAKADDARELIGFKHINGPQSWDAFAKALYAARWLDVERKKGENALSLLDITKRMGDTHTTIHRMVTALYVLQQAESEDLFSVEDRYKKSFSFSHLYTGLSYIEFIDFLGMERPQRSEDPSMTPVPPEYYPNLKNLLLWLYGSKIEEIAPVIKSQNPDLATLRDVLRSKAAIRVLAETGDLGAAIITATPTDVRFSKHLVEANAELAKAQQTMDGFDPHTQSELQEIANSAFVRAKLIKVTVDNMIETMSVEAKEE